MVVESAAHRLVRVPLPARTREPGGPRRTAVDVAPGLVTLRVRFTPPPGQHLDRRFGEPTSLAVTGQEIDGTAPGLGGWCFSRVADPPRAWSPGE